MSPKAKEHLKSIAISVTAAVFAIFSYVAVELNSVDFQVLLSGSPEVIKVTLVAIFLRSMIKISSDFLADTVDKTKESLPNEKEVTTTE